MHPILFRLGREPVYSYSVLLGVMLLLGLGWAFWMERRQPRRGRSVFWAVVAAVVGGRLAFILTHWPYYQEQPGQWLALWGASVDGYGAFLCGLAALAWHSRGQDFGATARALTPLWVAVAGVGWLASGLHGSGYGRVVPPGTGGLTVFWPDLYGLAAPRLPTQALGLVWSVIVVLALLAFRGGPRARQAFPASLVLYFGGDFLLQFTLGDNAGFYLLGLRWGQWAAAALVGLGAILAWRAARQ